MSNTKEDKAFPIKVEDEVYGPIDMNRIIEDVKSGELTEKAKFWDGEDWVPVPILLNEDKWIDEEWINGPEMVVDEDGPPLNASSAWEDVTRKGRWVMIYGDHLVMEGGNLSMDDINQIVIGEPRSGGIPLSKLINVNFKDLEEHVEIKASSFHKMYEVYILKSYLSKEHSNELIKELKDTKVRITTE